MPRPTRDQSAGLRHVTCRGNRRQAVFHDDDDRAWFVRLLDRVRLSFGWRVQAWCLMTNHFHLVLDVPAETISPGMQLLCGDFAQTFNWRHGFSGHLFQGRFRAESINDEAHFYEAVRYVDLNPERAGIVPRAEIWRWSSYRAHVDLEAPCAFHDESWVKRLGAERDSAAAAYSSFVDEGRRRPVPAGHVRGLTPDRSAMRLAEAVRARKPHR